MSRQGSLSSRENILSRIRKATQNDRIPMPFPEVDKDFSVPYVLSASNIEEKFAEEFIKLGGKFVFCDNELELIDNIYQLHESREWERLFCSEERLVRLFQNNKLDITTLPDVPLSDGDACITGCELVVARTGSVLFSSRQYLGRTASIYYPVHLIVVYSDQLVPDLKDAIVKLNDTYDGEWPSMLNLNTGPSRTADIEKTLVVGVHGPAEVFCFYVNAEQG